MLLALLSDLAGGHDEPSDILSDDTRIQRAIDYIEAHMEKDLGVTEIARISHLSPSQLTRLFKSSIGQTVWQYVIQRRCVRAIERL